jgi:hypothetical protein
MCLRDGIDFDCSVPGLAVDLLDQLSSFKQFTYTNGALE